MKKSRLIGVLCAVVFAVISMSAHAIGVSGQGTWETTLQGRDLDGNLTTAEAYYDTVLNITWLADANAGAGSAFDQGGPIPDGLMTLSNAKAWAASLDMNGIIGWRLPNTNPVDGTTTDDANISYIGTEDLGYNISAPGTLYASSTASEMAHLFYNTLGNLAFCDPSTSTVSTCNAPQNGWGLRNTGAFSNVQPQRYWSGTLPTVLDPWTFNFFTGEQSTTVEIGGFEYAWAVHDGDVGAAVVPVPAALWLFGSGLLGLIGVARKTHHAA